MKSPLRISRKILKAQYTDEFGGYSKTWFTDGIEKANVKKDSSDIMDISDDQSYQIQDFGMDGLARLVGLDIEAIALELAQREDSSIPPTQVLPVTEEDKLSQNTIRKRHSVSIHSRSSTPNVPLGEVRPGILSKKKQSPIINPMVLRPVEKPLKKSFSPDKVQNAFQNLFGNPGQNGSMMTPSFLDAKNTVKAQPVKQQKSVFDEVPANISSVFSPIPCQPHSTTSIFGIRGDNNMPYTPFNKNDLFTPKLSPQTVMSKVFKSPINKKQKITPGQFL